MAIKFATLRSPSPIQTASTKSDSSAPLITFTLREYDDNKLPTVHGDTTAAFVDLVVVDGKLAGTTQERWAAFGNLGKQIGEALDEGDIAVGRITSGEVSVAVAGSASTTQKRLPTSRRLEKALRRRSQPRRPRSIRRALRDERPGRSNAPGPSATSHSLTQLDHEGLGNDVTPDRVRQLLPIRPY